MVRLARVLISLLVLAAATIIGFAYLGDLTPVRQDVTQPVVLDAK